MKKPSTPIVVPTAEEKLARRNEFIANRLADGVKQAKDAAAEIAENFTKSLTNAEYQIRWMQGAYETIRFGQFCETAQAKGLELALDAAKSRLSSWRPENSSSPYANAASNEDFEAMRKFIENFEWLIKDEA